MLLPHLGYVTEENHRVHFESTLEAVLAWIGGRPINVIADWAGLSSRSGGSRNGDGVKAPARRLVILVRAGTVHQFLDMDRAISASEAQQRFSELLREVAEGRSFTVTSGGRPVARVLPVDRHQERGTVERLLKFVGGLPPRHTRAWSRDDLYE